MGVNKITLTFSFFMYYKHVTKSTVTPKSYIIIWWCIKNNAWLWTITFPRSVSPSLLGHLMREHFSSQRHLLRQGQGSSLHWLPSNQLNRVDFENCSLLVTVCPDRWPRAQIEQSGCCSIQPDEGKLWNGTQRRLNFTNILSRSRKLIDQSKV